MVNRRFLMGGLGVVVMPLCLIYHQNHQTSWPNIFPHLLVQAICVAKMLQMVQIVAVHLVFNQSSGST